MQSGDGGHKHPESSVVPEVGTTTMQSTSWNNCLGGAATIKEKAEKRHKKSCCPVSCFFCCLMHTINISKEGGPAYEFYFPQVHYTAGISAPLLLRIFKQQSCTVGVLPCSSHWGSGSTCMFFKSGISLRVPLLSHCPLWSGIPMLRWLC